MAEFIAVENIVKVVKKKRPQVKVCLFENIQAVTSYSLRDVAREFFDLPIHLLILGEPETRIGKIVEALRNEKSYENIRGLAYRDDNKKLHFTERPELPRDLDSMPIPAWELFPLKGYWIAGFAHAPVGRKRFLPLLTSRGCPFKCKFCLSPSVNPRWRSRSARNVVDEMEYLYRTLNVKDFHISDLNPTVNEKRIRDICSEILKRKLQIEWKIAQGTKIETIKEDITLELMAKAGCNFVAFSPETGSKRLLREVRKPFSHRHGLKMARKMVGLGIYVQCCFISGLPTEKKADRVATIRYMKKLILAGVDEIACYIFTPVPGSDLSQSIKGFKHYSQCTPSPNWREDYAKVKKFRMEMYIKYFIYKFYYPTKVAGSALRFLTGQYKTKMEMSLYKQIKLYLLKEIPFVFSKLNYRKELERISVIEKNYRR